MGGNRRRSAENLEVKTLPFFTETCNLAENTRDACLVALLFLSGRRISELIALQKRDLQLTSSGFLTVSTFNEKNFRYTPNREYTVEKEGEYTEYLKSYNPENYEKQTIKIPRALRYYMPIRIDISRSTASYRELGRYIENHLATLTEEDYVFHRMGRWGHMKGHIGRVCAYKIITKLDPSIWLHWFRHQRFTQVYNIAKAKSNDALDVVMILHDFTKHKRIDNTMKYIAGLKLREIRKEI